MGLGEKPLGLIGVTQAEWGPLAYSAASRGVVGDSGAVTRTWARAITGVRNTAPWRSRLGYMVLV